MSCIGAAILATAIVATDFPFQSSIFVDAENLNFENSKVMNDLGATIDLSKYPAVEGKKPEIYSFMEYGYSDNDFKSDNYSLYLYVYNPSQMEYVELTGSNTINMAFEYQTNADGTFVKDEAGELIATNYKNFSLKYCNASDGDYKNLFIKFRVLGLETVLKNVKKMQSEGFSRQYDLAGFQLLKKGGKTAQDYRIGQKVSYTGYAKGLGAGAENAATLSSAWEQLETVELDVHHTFYRTKTSSKGAGYQNQIDTVYFSVPERLFEEYGKLQRIKAEWYEYKTKEIVVTENTDFYNAASNWIGKYVGEDYDEDIGYSLGVNYRNIAMGSYPVYAADWGWNLKDTVQYTPTNFLHYLFLTQNISNYDPYADIFEIGGVTSSWLEEYIYAYSEENFDDMMLPIKDGTISAELFEDDIDENRKMDNERGKVQKGHSWYDFDADLDIQSWESWEDTNPNFWDNWTEFGIWDSIFNSDEVFPEEQGKSFSPIYIIQPSDLAVSKSDQEIADSLCINPQHVDELRAFYNEETTDGDGPYKDSDEEKRVVMFRFAVSDYYSESADIIEYGAGVLGTDIITEGEAYIAQQSIFFDFDIIQLTFNDNGVYTVIPVVANPIDIINPITPPVNFDKGCDDSTFRKVMGIITVTFFVWIFIKIVGGVRSRFIAEQTYKNTKKRK